MKNRNLFNCGQRLDELMSEHGRTQAQVAAAIGETAQSVSAKKNKTDMKVSDIEQIMNYLKMDLWEFFIRREDLSRMYNLNPETIEICRMIESQPKEFREMLAKTVRDTIMTFVSLKAVQE